MAEEQHKQKRTVPQNELDLNMLMTNSVWGKHEIPQELLDRLNRYYSTEEIITDSNGNAIKQNKITTASLWGLLGFYTRDMRLANLSNKPYNDELNYCKYHLDLAGDCLQSNLIEPFLICLSRVATVLELSQSKNGFLRKNFKTDTLENINVDKEPPKKSLFGLGKKQDG